MTTDSKFKILEERTLHEGFCPLKQYTVQYQRFDGTWSVPQVREIVAKPAAVGVVPIDLMRQQVVLIRQFRVGVIPHQADFSPWELEIVAGISDIAGEDALTTAQRELQEEVNLTAQRWERIGSYLTAPGYTTEHITLFWAEVDSSKAPCFAGLANEGEDIKLEVMPFVEAFRLVHDGVIATGVSIIALQWLELNWQRLV